MRKLPTLIVLFALIVTCSFSCSKNQYMGYMNATVNGSSWNTGEVIATKTTEGLTIQGTLTGTMSNIAVSLPRNYSTGTYTIDSSNLNAHGSYVAHSYDNTILLARSGTVTVKSLSPYVEGTFSFVCTDSTKIENGSFSVKAP